jgi:hypothetical protein
VRHRRRNAWPSVMKLFAGGVERLANFQSYIDFCAIERMSLVWATTFLRNECAYDARVTLA